MDKQNGGKNQEEGKDVILDGGEVKGNDLIEGGELSGYHDLEVRPPTHREKTARWLAILLVSILGGSALVHYLTIAVFVYLGKADDADRLGGFFNAWFPAITGLVGSATTYYFTKEKQ